MRNVEHGGVWPGFVDRGSPARSGGGVLLVTGSDVYFDRKLRCLELGNLSLTPAMRFPFAKKHVLLNAVLHVATVLKKTRVDQISRRSFVNCDSLLRVCEYPCRGRFACLPWSQRLQRLRFLKRASVLYRVWLPTSWNVRLAERSVAREWLH